jgi:hypothetical protein
MEAFTIITFIGGMLVGAGIATALIFCFFYWLFSRSE